MLPGEVGRVRELARGIEADVCVGVDPTRGWAVVHVVSQSEPVQEALRGLKAALRDEAQAMLDGAAADALRRHSRRRSA